jgi:hypothetical protein
MSDVKKTKEFDLIKMMRIIDEATKAGKIELMQKQRQRLCELSTAFQKRIDKLTREINRAEGKKDLLEVTKAITEATTTTTEEPKEKLVSFAATGLPVDTDIQVRLVWVRRTGGRYQFVFENPKTGQRFQVNRPVGPWTTPEARAVIRYTLLHILGKKVTDSKLAEGMNALCNKPLKAQVVIKVYGTQGSLNFQTRGSW